MRPLRWKLLPLALLVVVAGLPAGSSAVRAFDRAQADDEAGEGRQDGQLGRLRRVEEVAQADLSEIRFAPLAWRGSRVRFVLQFRELVRDWDPYLTRFGTTDWVAFSGWSDSRFTWDAEVYGDPLSTLFVRRGGELAEMLAGFRMHQRFEATGIVRAVFLDRPWIEITSVAPLDEHVPEGTILHVSRAREFMRKQQWDLALQQFERAKAAPLPAHARAELDRQIIECQTVRKAVETHETAPPTSPTTR